jgi:WbqC-like protein family
MTVPLKEHRLGQRIDEVCMAPIDQWRNRHMELLRSSFYRAAYADEALQIAASVYAVDYPSIGALARASLLALTNYFGLNATTRFVDVTDLGIDGVSSNRVLAVVQRLKGTTYITGHGAARYLDYEIFERVGVQVEYMKYLRRPYPQSHGDFTPYVSGLDLVAHCGPSGAEYICSNTSPWREFINEPA